MDKNEWISRCEKRYMDRGGANAIVARQFAEAAYEAQQEFADDLTPEEAADVDMSYWTE
ncbi:hypothetical protein HFK83_03065 [Ralstonia pseudosolanacearum]|uniref:hypothetical protein n=1 Tax=Ralstonia pseudosolanacearum TaxID=1310165 RepID=UPI00200379DB|nr:hypothetical protein [Ralstonia pseudosolanacearum]MCK4121351.1 hypothetical protein [Ralstonia pseudosolanacearum]